MSLCLNIREKDVLEIGPVKIIITKVRDTIEGAKFARMEITAPKEMKISLIQFRDANHKKEEE